MAWLLVVALLADWPLPLPLALLATAAPVVAPVAAAFVAAVAGPTPKIKRWKISAH